MTTSLKRLLLWLSGAPEDQGPPVDVNATPSATPAAATPVAAPADPAVEFLAARPAPEPAPVAALPVTDTLLDTREVHVPAEPINDATAYGVAVVPADVPPGATYWQAVRVHHLTPTENHGNHHIFLDALDEGGNRINGARARITWPGGEQTITVDKPLNEPGANFPTLEVAGGRCADAGPAQRSGCQHAHRTPRRAARHRQHPFPPLVPGRFPAGSQSRGRPAASSAAT